MLEFTNQHKEKLKKLGVAIIYLFGSQAKGKTHPLSDFDIGVVLENPARHQRNSLGLYQELYEIITDILPKDYLKKRLEARNHEVDIVFLQFAPVYLQFEAAANGKVLYENREESALDYKEEMSKRFCDLQYFYNISRQGVLERI